MRVPRSDCAVSSRQKRRKTPGELFVPLTLGADPVTWDWSDQGPDHAIHNDPPGMWAKIGGTPQFLQGDEFPPGDGWKFALRFSADSAGQELGDGAECYAFVTDDGRGAFLWQCH